VSDTHSAYVSSFVQIRSYTCVMWHAITTAQQYRRWATVATIDMGRKEGATVLLSRGELGPRLTQCGLGRGLLPYQVASSSIRPFGHNRHGPKIGWGTVPVFLGGTGSSSNTKSPGPRPTFIPSGILVHPAVWPQRTWAKNGACVPIGEGSWIPI